MLAHLLLMVFATAAPPTLNAQSSGGYPIDPIQGTVYSTKGVPIAGATVEFGETIVVGEGATADWQIIAKATSAANGSFTLGRQRATLPDRFRELRISAPGFVPEDLVMQSDSKHPQRFFSDFYGWPMANADSVLVPARQLTGTVTDPQGKPIAGATIKCAASQSTASSDANGRFILQDVPDYSSDAQYGRAIFLDVSHPDYVSTKSDAAGNAQNVTISMNPGVQIEGVVRERETGKGTPGVYIFGSPAGGLRVTAPVDAEGKYRLRLPAGPIVLNVRRQWTKDPLANNYVAVKQDQTVFVAEGETRSGVDILVTKGRVIRGRVVDSVAKQPAEGVYLRVVPEGDRSARYGASTDAEGRFVISGVASGRYSIASPPRDAEVQIQKKTLDVPKDSDPEPVELTAIRRLTDADLPESEPLVTGKTVYPDGRPALMATVTAYPDVPGGGRTTETCRSSPDGTFGFNLAYIGMSGPGEIRACDVEKKFVGVVEVQDLSAPLQPLVITLGKGATFSGTVRDDKGQPVPGISVMVSRMVWMGNTSAQYAMCRGITDSAGKYTTSPFVPSSKDTAAALECQAMRDGHSWAIKPEGKYSSLNVTPGAHTDGLDFTLVIEGHEAYFAAKPAQGK